MVSEYNWLPELVVLNFWGFALLTLLGKMQASLYLAHRLSMFIGCRSAFVNMSLSLLLFVKYRVVFLCVVLFCGAIFWLQTVKKVKVVSRVATVFVHMASSRMIEEILSCVRI